MDPPLFFFSPFDPSHHYEEINEIKSMIGSQYLIVYAVVNVINDEYLWDGTIDLVPSIYQDKKTIHVIFDKLFF